MNWILLWRLPVRNHLAKVLCLIIYLLTLKGKCWHFSWIVCDFAVYALLEWVDRCFLLLFFFENDGSTNFWINTSFILIGVSNEISMLLLLDSKVSSLDAFRLCKGNFTFEQRIFHPGDFFLFFILRLNFRWNYFWYLQSKKTIVHSKKQKDPLVTVWSVWNVPFFCSQILTVTAFHSLSNFLNRQWSISLMLVSDWSLWTSFLVHLINDLWLDGDLSSFDVVRQLLVWDLVVHVGIHNHEEFSNDLHWNFKRCISLSKILGWTVVVISQFLHTECFIRCLCSQWCFSDSAEIGLFQLNLLQILNNFFNDWISYAPIEWQWVLFRRCRHWLLLMLLSSIIFIIGWCFNFLVFFFLIFLWRLQVFVLIFAVLWHFWLKILKLIFKIIYIK